MVDTFVWWLVIEALGLIGLPLAFLLLRRLPDAGYAFAKPFSLVFGGYLFWLALSFGILPNRTGAVVWVFIVVAALSALVLRHYRDEIVAAGRERWRLIVATEVVFTVVLFTVAHLRAFVPEISGTEKPMDFLLLNAANRSESYPPADPWLAGFDVSYYYFGYVINAMAGKLTGLSTAVVFNLGVASTAALAATAAFGLGYNLVSLLRGVSFRTGVIGGAIAVVLLIVLGNLEGAAEFGRANGIGSDGFYRGLGVEGILSATESETWHPTESSSFWWWWRATRIVPDTITEFPFFSFLLGDLHPHVMAVPFVLLAAALGLSFWRSVTPLSWETWRREPWLLVISAVVVGALGFLNTWDLPTFGFVTLLLVLARNLGSGGGLRQGFVDSASFVLPLALLAVVLYVPFYVSFSSQAAGLDPVTTAATRPLHLALIWAPLFLLALPVAFAVAFRPGWRDEPAAVLLAASPIGAVLIVWLLLALADGSGDAIGERGLNWLTAAFLALAVFTSALALYRSVRDTDDRYTAAAPALTLIFTGTLLILGAEFFYITDVFNSRLNTVFKLYYQAWILLAIGGAYGLVWALQEWQPLPSTPAGILRGVWTGGAALAVAGALLYPLGATLSRTEGLAAEPHTLDGLEFAARTRFNDFDLALWVAEHADDDDVVLEAVGGQYSEYGRIAAWTGVPTVLGWPGHETQWGRSNELVSRRMADVDAAYSAATLDEAFEVLAGYRVSYIVVGGLERATYPAAGIDKFSDLPVAFESGESIIYRVPQQTPQSVGRELLDLIEQPWLRRP